MSLPDVSAFIGAFLLKQPLKGYFSGCYRHGSTWFHWMVVSQNGRSLCNQFHPMSLTDLREMRHNYFTDWTLSNFCLIRNPITNDMVFAELLCIRDHLIDLEKFHRATFHNEQHRRCVLLWLSILHNSQGSRKNSGKSSGCSDNWFASFSVTLFRFAFSATTLSAPCRPRELPAERHPLLPADRLVWFLEFQRVGLLEGNVGTWLSVTGYGTPADRGFWSTRHIWGRGEGGNSGLRSDPLDREKEVGHLLCHSLDPQGDWLNSLKARKPFIDWPFP